MRTRTDPPQAQPPLRYAVLHHTGHGAPHFDLMFETSPGSPLLTFRSPVWPVTGGAQLQRLVDHRPVYLGYEGPVSGGRGDVRAVARGTHRLSGDATGLVVTFLSGADHPPIRIKGEAQAPPNRRSTGSA